MKPGLLLTIPATVLQTAAGMLRFAAAVGDRLASVISPAPASDIVWQRKPQTPERTTVPAAPAPAEAAAAPVEVRQEPGSDAQPLDLAALASQPAPAVIAQLDNLSAVELADLYDHESRHRRRPEVLAAVEAAAAPPPAARGEDPLVDEVRIPDELVYTTQTPRR